MNLTLLLLLSVNILLAHAGVTPAETKGLEEEQLYAAVVVGDHEEAVYNTLNLEQNQKGAIIAKVIDRLLSESKRITLDYAYQLWNKNYNGKAIVKKYFPIQFRMIMNQNYVSIVNKRDNFALKLGLTTDSQNDRQAYGAPNDKVSDRVSWKFIPVWENNRLYVQIVNNKHSQYLKLETDTDSQGEHKAWGSDNADTQRHQWYLQPVKHENDLLFYIYNREYNHALKLGRDVDSAGDRVLWGQNGHVEGSPDLFGWYIRPF